MSKTILLTGGAGFVGSHTADALLQRGHRVRIFDNLAKQVHGSRMPAHLPAGADFIVGDVRNLPSLTEAVRGVDVIYHFAAAVGVGQSMYEIADYCDINIQGTANLLQAILDTHSLPEKLIVASSMSIYGEGRCFCSQCGEVSPQPRSLAQLRQKDWELHCPGCDGMLTPIPTDEDKPLNCTSVYAISKKVQEEMVLLFGRTYGIPAVAFRYFNIYGARQSLSNPYTGVAAIFASRVMNGKPPLVFEDGSQLRDFVSVHDVVQANLLALESSAAHGMALNVASGEAISVCQVASGIARMLGVNIPSEVTGKYRSGDIRHCFADISRISQTLGYRPQRKFRDGLVELVDWLNSQSAHDRTSEAFQQLTTHGLVA